MRNSYWLISLNSPEETARLPGCQNNIILEGEETVLKLTPHIKHTAEHIQHSTNSNPLKTPDTLKL